MKIWEPKPPGTLWSTPGLLRDSFTFNQNMTRKHCSIVLEVTAVGLYYDCINSGVRLVSLSNLQPTELQAVPPLFF
jgi:hypothetical protein